MLEDSREVLRVCDVVLGSIVMMLALAITIACFAGRASVRSVALLWTIPIVNVGWSVYTRRWNRQTAEALRNVF